MNLRQYSQILSMSVLDLRREYLMSLWTILGLAAVVAPLLVMFGLKFGIISSMESRLLESALNREVRPTDFRTYQPDWFASLQARDDVGFVIPDTRLLAAGIRLTRSANPDAGLADVTMRPTIAGDPFLEEWGMVPAADNEIVLTTRVADVLNVVTGETIEGVVKRRRGEESVVIDLQVAGVLPRDALDRNWAYVRLPLMVAVERYRENQDVPGFNLPGTLPDPFESEWAFGSFRAIAATIDDVRSLVEWLEGQGIPTHSNYTRIARIQQLDEALSLVFAILVGVAILGGATSMGANLFAAVLRKQHELSLLRLVGYSSKAIVMFPVVQSILLTLLGGLFAVGVYGLLEPVVNNRLGSQMEGMFVSRLHESEPICRLLPEHYAGVVATMLVLGVLASSVGALRAAAITPADGLRRE